MDEELNEIGYESCTKHENGDLAYMDDEEFHEYLISEYHIFDFN